MAREAAADDRANHSLRADDKVWGIDGCRGGWLCAVLSSATGASPERLEIELHASLVDCLAASGNSTVAIDIPIGLPDVAEPGGRLCDRQARRQLGRPRASSVFTPPGRPALNATGYRDAIRLNGRGMSRQAFHILAKIREADAALEPAEQARVHECHPELAFMRLAGVALNAPKRTATGHLQRRRLLEGTLGYKIDTEAVRTCLGPTHVAPDDILDAAVLTLSARHIATGKAYRLGSNERDARGREMAIWY